MKPIKFNCAAKKVQDIEKDFHISLANIDNLKTLMPTSVNLNDNFDLIGIVLNAAVGNFCNKNGDCITNKDLVMIGRNFVNKYVDLEHDKSKIAGVIVNYGFSKMGSNELMTEEDVIKSKDPVNLSLAVVLWKTLLSDELLEFIEASADPKSDKYNAISASWELLFSEYNICLSSSKNPMDGKVITGSDKTVYEEFLGKNTGIGKLDGKYLFRLLSLSEGNFILPTGIGLVENPAAEVKGLKIVAQEMEDPEDEEEKEDKPENESEDPESEKESPEKETEKEEIEIEFNFSEDMSCPECGEMSPKNTKKDSEMMTCGKCGKKSEGSKWTKNSINSNNAKNSVINNSNQNKIEKLMIIKSFKDLTDENLKEIKAADIQKVHEQFVADSIKEVNEKYEAKLKENEVLASKQAEATEKLEKAQETIKEIETKLAEIQAKEVAREAEAAFQARIASLDETFVISDAARAAIVKDVRALASAEDFEAYKSKMEIFLTKKASTSTASAKEESKEDKKDVVTDAVKTAEAKVELPNAQGDKETYRTQWEKAFDKKNITIKLK